MVGGNLAVGGAGAGGGKKTVVVPEVKGVLILLVQVLGSMWGRRQTAGSASHSFEGKLPIPIGAERFDKREKEGGFSLKALGRKVKKNKAFNLILHYPPEKRRPFENHKKRGGE